MHIRGKYHDDQIIASLIVKYITKKDEEKEIFINITNEKQEIYYSESEDELKLELILT